MSSRIILIGPADALPALSERFDTSAELHTFTDAEALEALDQVIQIKPRIVALEKEFSATSRGRALITRINDDPSLEDCEIRVIAHDNAPSPVAQLRSPTGAVLAVEEPQSALSTARSAGLAGPLDQRGTRRAERIAVRDGVEVLVDGNAALLVDISVIGLQVLSTKTLRPNQRVRVALPEGKRTIRCDGAVAWASYEMPKGQSPRFRAGIELSGADPAAIKRYAERHKRA